VIEENRTFQFEDRTELRDAVRNYESSLKLDPDKIIRRRSPDEEFDDIYTIQNLSLKFAQSHDFIPQIAIPCRCVTDYFCTRIDFERERYGAYIKISDYVKRNYNDSGIDLRFSVVNRIAAFMEFEPQLTRHRDHLTQRGYENMEAFGRRSIGNREYYRYLVNPSSKGRNEHYVYSDKPWEDRGKLCRWVGLPFATLPMRLHGNSILCRISEGLDPYELGLPTSGLDQDSIINREFNVSYYIADLYKDCSWMQQEEAIVSKYIDTSLFRFLTRREIPIWASIVSNVRYRPLQDNELDFLNDSIALFNPLLITYPNAVTLLIMEFLWEFMEELIELNLVGRCGHCGALFRYRKGKRFCSRKSEGRDCGKAARNKRHYQRNRQQIKDRCREDMRLYRDLQKELSKK